MALIDKQDVLRVCDAFIMANHDRERVMKRINELPTVQDEKLERCLFEYINACRTVNCPTPDTTRKDRRDAYAVVKVLQPIFGDVTF